MADLNEFRWIVNGFLEWHEGAPCPEGLIERARAAVPPETQSPPEGGEGLEIQKEPRERCPSKQQRDFATLRDALQQIADMDPKGIRADDLGRAARIASGALGVATPQAPSSRHSDKCKCDVCWNRYEGAYRPQRTAGVGGFDRG